MKTFFATVIVAAMAIPSTSKAAETRACVDAEGHMAVCSGDPRIWHECLFSDKFGRCPKDPVCYDRDGKQTRCIGNVVAKKA